MRWLTYAVFACAVWAAPLAAEEPVLEIFGDENAIFSVAEPGESLPEHWIGVHCVAADDALQSHLGLKQGLVVQHVAPEGPAAKAGIQRHDVLLTVDGKELTDVGQLTRLIGELKDKEVSVDLIRGGKRQSVKITPAKRPEGQAAFPFEAARLGKFPGNLDPEVQQFFQKFGAPGQEGAVRMRILHPGMITQKLAEMPQDLSVQITRSGNEPAKIVVKKGDKTWDVTEKELDKLPEEIRVHVGRMVHSPLGGDVIRWHAAAPAPGFPGVPGVPVRGVIAVPPIAIAPLPAPVAGQRVEYRVLGGPGASDLEKKLKDLQERVEALEKQQKK